MDPDKLILILYNEGVGDGVESVKSNVRPSINSAQVFGAQVHTLLYHDGDHDESEDLISKDDYPF